MPAEEKPMRPVIIHLTPEILEQVRALARQEERPVSRQLRHLILLALDYLKNQPPIRPGR